MIKTIIYLFFKIQHVIEQPAAREEEMIHEGSDPMSANLAVNPLSIVKLTSEETCIGLGVCVCRKAAPGPLVQWQPPMKPPMVLNRGKPT